MDNEFKELQEITGYIPYRYSQETILALVKVLNEHIQAINCLAKRVEELEKENKKIRELMFMG